MYVVTIAETRYKTFKWILPETWIKNNIFIIVNHDLKLKK